MITIDDLVRHIFRIKSFTIYEENLARFTRVKRRTINRIQDAHKSPFIVPIPERKEVSLKEAIKDAVEQIKKSAKDKHICLLWSGGIDSTLVFCALVEENIPFTVLTDENSKREYPFLYEKIVKGGYNCDYKVFGPRGLIDLLKLAEEKNYVFVTGEIGDQLTGSMITMRYPYEQRSMSMKDVIETDLFCKPGDASNRFVTKYHPVLIDGYNGTQLAIKHCEDTIYEFLGTTPENTTLSEFLWGLNFIFKYMLVMLRLYQVGLYFEGDNKNTIHFFNTVKFQQWAMWNYKENCGYVKDNEYNNLIKDIQSIEKRIYLLTQKLRTK